MKRPRFAVLRLLAAAAVVITALGLGLAAASAAVDPGDPVGVTHRMDEQMQTRHRVTGMGDDTSTEMDETHADMSARLSEHDRESHDRMHEACSDQTHERNYT